jgi:CRP-like cAMP-binding protein
MSYSLILRASFQRLQDFVFLDGRGRLIKTLLQHSMEAPEVGSCARVIRKPLTQSQLAAFTGNSRESVNRWLKSFARQGIVELSKDGVVILQPEVLKAQIDQMGPITYSPRGPLLSRKS